MLNSKRAVTLLWNKCNVTIKFLSEDQTNADPEISAGHWTMSDIKTMSNVESFYI